MKESLLERGYISATIKNKRREKEFLENLEMIDDDMIINKDNRKRKRKINSDESMEED